MPPLRWIYCIIFFNFQIPTLILDARETGRSPFQKRLGLLQKIILLCILAALAVPIGMDTFGYTSRTSLFIHIFGYPCAVAVYWAAFILIMLKGKGCADTLELIAACFYLVTGAVLGKESPAQCYWVLVLLSLALIIVSVLRLSGRRKKST